MTREEAKKVFEYLEERANTQEPCEDAEQIDYHDDFETALKKMYDYVERQTEKNCDTCINKDRCSPNIREIVRKNGCPKWTPNKDMYEPLLPMGKYLKTSFPCDAEDDVKQTKQEPCDDAISRDAVIDFIDRERDFIKAKINKLPSVTQKSGKWIGYSDEGYVEEAIEKLELMRQKVDEETYRALILAIKALEQKSKTGHWIYDETIENWRCSKCNETPKTMGYCGTADFMAEHFKFCNHCGAKMVEPQESEDKE